MSNVKSMGKFSGNGKLRGAREALLDSANDISDGEVLHEYKNVLILHLDDSDGAYNVRFNQAGMSMTECIALCEVAKIQFLEQMGYFNEQG